MCRAFFNHFFFGVVLYWEIFKEHYFIISGKYMYKYTSIIYLFIFSFLYDLLISI